MALQIVLNIFIYAAHILKGLFEMIIGKEETIRDVNGNIISKLPSKRKRVYVFAKNFLKEPVMLGSAFPSSQFLTNKILAPIDFEKARLIVEYGAGVGNMSVEILRRMHKDAKLVAFELNEDLADFLKREYNDERLITSGRSAADIQEVLHEHNLGKADYIISGIPFSTMPPKIAEDIMKATKSSLKPKGKFLVYQVRNKVLDFLKPTFKHIERTIEFINLPPHKVFYAYN